MTELRRQIFAAFYLLFTLALVCATGAFAQESPYLTPGNLVVVVEGCGVYGGACTSVANGNGSGVGNSSVGGYGDNEAAPLTLFQYAPTGAASATYVNSLVLPQTPSGANLPVSGEYGSSSEGGLQLDGTGRYLTLMGYGIDAPTFDAAYHPANPPGNYATGSSVTDPYGAAPSGALAQSGSLKGQYYTPIPRVIALIDPYGNINSSTAIYNIFNNNNPRSVYTADGLTSAYVSGQGTGCDSTGGVFYIGSLFAVTTAPTAITGNDAAGGNNGCPNVSSNQTLAQDTRVVQVYNGTLYISVDSTEGKSFNRSFIGTLGTAPVTGLYVPPASAPYATGPTMLTGFGNSGGTGRVKLNTAETNGINANNQYINLSPENYFFASPTVLYVTDSGTPKNTSAENEAPSAYSTCGAGGLQKWVNVGGTWTWEYTLYKGLNLVKNANSDSTFTCSTNTSGATGLIGLAGKVVSGVAYLYVTNFNISDLDHTYLYGITDTVATTSNPGTTFTQLAAAPPDSNFKGVSFAPSLPAGSATITSSPSGLAFTSSGTGCAPGTYITPATLLWTSGNPCTLSVASPQGSSGMQYAFSQWQDGTTATTDYVTAPVTSAVYSATFLNLPIVTLSPSPVSTNYGGGVLLTATVTWGGNPVTSGTVTFHNGSTSLGFGAVNSSGVATLSTTTLPVGLDNLTASYAAQGQYSGATSSAVTESVVQPPSISLTTTAALLTVTNGYQATVTIKNTGNATANNVQITLAALGSATASVPVNIGSIAGNGGSAQVVLNFPSSAGSPGAGVAEKYSGTYTGGSFSASIRATLP